MPEKLYFRLDDTPSIFAISALTKAGSGAFDNAHAKSKEQGYNEVQLLVNGVEVPFHATILDWWQRCESDINQRAANLALEKFDKLSEISESIDELNRLFREQIKQRIEDAFGITMRESDRY